MGEREKQGEEKKGSIEGAVDARSSSRSRAKESGDGSFSLAGRVEKEGRVQSPCSALSLHSLGPFAAPRTGSTRLRWRKANKRGSKIERGKDHLQLWFVVCRRRFLS